MQMLIGQSWSIFNFLSSYRWKPLISLTQATEAESFIFSLRVPRYTIGM